MSYQVIARKYRPQRFDDVVGQEHVTRTLANAIRSGRIAHAYLFCGPRGTGKTTVARIFAKALNCTGGPNPDFDDNDVRCREIAEGRSLDVLEIDGASNNGVEQVRELRDTARFAPAASRFKIYIIDEVHMLSTAAFNALLKTLEEPPAHVKFLFATTDPEKVLPTILSRCQRFDLRRIPTALIVKHLAKIAAAEGVEVDEVALQAIGRGSDGGLRDAESTLDQLISFCGGRVEEADVLSMFGLSARAQLLALSRAILGSDAAAALQELNELARNGKDLGRLLSDLLQHFRNLLVFQVTGGDPAMLEVSEAEVAELKEQAAQAPAESVTRVLEVLTTAEGRLRDASARKIFLEVTLMKAIQARNSVSLDVVLRQLRQLRDAAPEPAPAAAPSPLNPPNPPSPASPASPASPTPPTTEPAAATDDLAALWARVVAASTPLTKTALQAGRPLSFEKGVFTVGYAPASEAHRALVDVERTRTTVNARLSGGGRPVSVKFVRLSAEEAGEEAAPPALKPLPSAAAAGHAASGGVASSGAPASVGPGPGSGDPNAGAATKSGAAARTRPEKVTPMRVDPAEFKNDPLIREAIELFKGQLVEIRGPSTNEET